MKSLLILCAASFAALGAPQETTEASAPNDEMGSISGKVVFEGDRPAAKPALEIKDSETKGCKHHDGSMAKEDRSMLISKDGGVQNVVMMIEAIEAKPSDKPVVLDQVGCRFEPRVAVVPVGGTIRFANSDETNHNIHTFAKKNQALNKNVAGGANLDQKLEKAEVINVKCDVHTWMKSYVVVTEASHFAVSGADGSYKIEGLPAGEYKIEWWHEELGKGKTEVVKVEAGKNTEFNHKVSAGKKKGGGRRRR